MTKFKLTLERAKEVCDDFRIVQRKDLGRPACIHLMSDEELCRNGAHFLCELVLFKRAFYANQERNQQVAIRAEEMAVLDTCPRKYHLLHEKALKGPGGDPVASRSADAFRMARARLDIGEVFDLEQLRDDLPKVETAKLRAAVRFYMDHPPYDRGTVECERHCQVEFEGTWFEARAAAITNDSKTIYEWRYGTGSYTELSVSRQAAILFTGFPEADEFIVLRLKKSQARMKKAGESLLSYEDRILDTMKEDPRKVFGRLRIRRDEIDIDETLRQMALTMKKVLPVLQDAGMPPNFESCASCDFQILCAESLGAPTSLIVRQMTETDQ